MAGAAPGPRAGQRLSPRTLRARVRREGWWHPFPDVVGAPGLAVDDRAIDVLQRRDTSLADLERLLGEHRRFRGRPNLRQVVHDLASAGRTDSPFEFEARQRFAGDGVPLDRGQVAVPLRDGGRIHMDLGIAAIRLGIEAESLAWHASRDQLDRDAMRANAITAVTDDWRVFRLTWTIMRERWGEFVAEVRETIAAQSQRHLGVPWPRPGDLQT